MSRDVIVSKAFATQAWEPEVGWPVLTQKAGNASLCCNPRPREAEAGRFPGHAGQPAWSINELQIQREPVSKNKVEVTWCQSLASTYMYTSIPHAPTHIPTQHTQIKNTQEWMKISTPASFERAFWLTVNITRVKHSKPKDFIREGVNSKAASVRNRLGNVDFVP